MNSLKNLYETRWYKIAQKDWIKLDKICDHCEWKRKYGLRKCQNDKRSGTMMVIVKNVVRNQQMYKFTIGTRLTLKRSGR